MQRKIGTAIRLVFLHFAKSFLNAIDVTIIQ